MKTKVKIFTSLLALILVASSSSILIANNNIQSLNSNNKANNASNNILTFTKEEINAKLIGASKGTFDIKYTNVDECTILNISHSFEVHNSFNFNGGHFTLEGITYTITKIGKNVFNSDDKKHFYNCYLTIPSTIKEIDNDAFCDCSKIRGDKEIISINFEEGVEIINPSAFCCCKDLIEKTIKLPNSLKYLGNCAFVQTKIEIIDLTALDHVISTGMDAITYYDGHALGCLFTGGCGILKVNTNNLKKVYFKDETMKSKYLNDNH